MARTPAEIFWGYVQQGARRACWPWLGTRQGAYGHGMFSSLRLETPPRRTPYLAHRVAWFLARGCWPAEDQLVLHTCDNGSCCNPEHLYVGSQRNNVDDMLARQRHWSMPQGGSIHAGVQRELASRTARGKAMPFLRSDNNAAAKLTADQVRAIRESPLSCRALAALYGCSSSSVSDIKNRRRWRHVE